MAHFYEPGRSPADLPESERPAFDLLMATDAGGAPAPHSHSFLGAGHAANTRRTLWVVGLTAAMMVVEVVAGFLTGSMALLADGFHMATHAGALGVAALAYLFARRHAEDPRFSFGTGKVGDLAGFASALVLALVALGMGVESVARLMDPGTVAFGEAMVVAVLGLAVNIASALLLAGGPGHSHGHSHGHAHGHSHSHGHHLHGDEVGGADNNLRAAYLHVIADAATSALAIVALAAGWALGWWWCDPLMGIVGGVLVGSWAIGLLRDTAAVLLDRRDDHVAQEVREAVEGPGDAKITDLHVWQVGPDARAAIVSVVAPGLDADAIRARLAPVDEIRHLTVEVA